mmetsp:Transcript_31065/g.49892  ORF Transcript_31065/g.49892 Transcript_31065/m.49892 type:complete len:333 (+) Transcript_31065:519-1517(+)
MQILPLVRCSHIIIIIQKRCWLLLRLMHKVVVINRQHMMHGHCRPRLLLLWLSLLNPHIHRSQQIIAILALIGMPPFLSLLLFLFPLLLFFMLRLPFLIFLLPLLPFSLFVLWQMLDMHCLNQIIQHPARNRIALDIGSADWTLRLGLVLRDPLCNALVTATVSTLQTVRLHQDIEAHTARRLLLHRMAALLLLLLALFNLTLLRCQRLLLLLDLGLLRHHLLFILLHLLFLPLGLRRQLLLRFLHLSNSTLRRKPSHLLFLLNPCQFLLRLLLGIFNELLFLLLDLQFLCRQLLRVCLGFALQLFFHLLHLLQLLLLFRRRLFQLVHFVLV